MYWIRPQVDRTPADQQGRLVWTTPHALIRGGTSPLRGRVLVIGALGIVLRSRPLCCSPFLRFFLLFGVGFHVRLRCGYRFLERARTLT